MKTYEITFIIPDKFDEKETSQISEKIKKIVGGEILNEKLWGRRKFAYPISKSDFGYYVTLVFKNEPDKIAKIDAKLKLEEDIIRHLIVIAAKPPKQKPPKKEKPEEVKEVKKEEKPEKEIKELPKPKIKKKTELKAKPEKAKKPKKSKITQEMEDEDVKMKTLDEKLDEILKE